LVWFFAGVSPGTTAENGIPSSYVNEPRGSVSLIVISPVASFGSMPVTPPFLVLRYSSAPTMPV
jgi:hypothetical protein